MGRSQRAQARVRDQNQLQTFIFISVHNTGHLPIATPKIHRLNLSCTSSASGAKLAAGLVASVAVDGIRDRVRDRVKLTGLLLSDMLGEEGDVGRTSACSSSALSTSIRSGFPIFESIMTACLLKGVL
jgi:hypothetical protein